MIRVCQASCVLGLAIACVVSAAAWVYLLAAHGGYWLTSQRLPAGREPATSGWPGVVAVVPARNEADMLPVTLPALLGQDYPGKFRVIVVDDGSDDGTGEIAAELGDKSLRDGGAPLTVLAGQPRPEGWAGKVWAMSQGLAAAARTGETAETRYVLFTDADISWGPGALRELAGRRRARRPGAALADGAAARRDGLGTGNRARVRLLLRPALPVPAGQRPGQQDRGRGRRMHADQEDRPRQRP